MTQSEPLLVRHARGGWGWGLWHGSVYTEDRCVVARALGTSAGDPVCDAEGTALGRELSEREAVAIYHADIMSATAADRKIILALAAKMGVEP